MHGFNYQLSTDIYSPDKRIAASQGRIRRSRAIVRDDQVTPRDLRVLVSGLEGAESCRCSSVVGTIPPEHDPPELDRPRIPYAVVHNKKRALTEIRQAVEAERRKLLGRTQYRPRYHGNQYRQ